MVEQHVIVRPDVSDRLNMGQYEKIAEECVIEAFGEARKFSYTSMLGKRFRAVSRTMKRGGYQYHVIIVYETKHVYVTRYLAY